MFKTSGTQSAHVWLCPQHDYIYKVLRVLFLYQFFFLEVTIVFHFHDHYIMIKTCWSVHEWSYLRAAQGDSLWPGMRVCATTYFLQGPLITENKPPTQRHNIDQGPRWLKIILTPIKLTEPFYWTCNQLLSWLSSVRPTRKNTSEVITAGRNRMRLSPDTKLQALRTASKVMDAAAQAHIIKSYEYLHFTISKGDQARQSVLGIHLPSIGLQPQLWLLPMPI